MSSLTYIFLIFLFIISIIHPLISIGFKLNCLFIRLDFCCFQKIQFIDKIRIQLFTLHKAQSKDVIKSSTFSINIRCYQYQVAFYRLHFTWSFVRNLPIY